MTLLEITLCAIAGLGVALTLLIFLFRGPEDTFAMGAVRLLNRVVCRMLHDVTAMDRDGKRIVQSLPIEGPCIVVANHRSGADPSLIGATTSRYVCFLMAREYYETPGMQWLFLAPHFRQEQRALVLAEHFVSELAWLPLLALETRRW